MKFYLYIPIRELGPDRSLPGTQVRKTETFAEISYCNTTKNFFVRSINFALIFFENK